MVVTGTVLPGSAATPRFFIARRRDCDEAVIVGRPVSGKFQFTGEMS
jgi:hypothetical protein